MSVRNLLLIASCSTTLTLAFSPALADEGLVCDGRNFDLLNPDFYNEPLGFNKIDDVGDEVQYSDDLGKAYAQAMVNESMPFDFDCGLPECYEDAFLPESTVLPVDEPIVVEEPETSPTPPENPPPSTPSTPASSPEVSSVSSSDLPHPSTDVTPVVDNKGDEGDCGDDKGDKHSYKRDTQGLSKHTSVKRLWSRSTDIEQRTIPHSTFAGVFVPFERSNQSLTERNRVGNFNDDLEGVIPRWKRGTVLKFSVRVCQCPKGRGSDLVVAMNRAVGTWAQVNSVIRVSKGGRQYYETQNLIGFDAVPEKSTLPIDFLVRCNPTQKLNPNNGRNVNAEAFFPNDRTKDTIEVYPAAFASNSVEKLSIILQHELGHILGLAHEVLNADRSVAFPDQSANKFSVMGQETKRSTNLLDTAAVRKLYGLDEGKVISGHVVKAYASRRSKAPKDFAAGDFAKDQCKPPPPPSERNCRVVTQRVCN